MRSNYKLITWYPSLPKDWEVGMEVGQGDRNAMMANFSPLSSKYSDVQLPYKEVVNNSKFWDEVSEFPKIVSFRATNVNKTVIKIATDGYFNNYSLDSMLHIDGCVDSGHFEIYQVAVSETEVFTLGDKVTYNYKANYAPWIIDNFLLRSDGKILARSKNNSICEIVSEIKKVPEPLFVTEDNVKIFEGDEYWYVQTGEYTKRGLFNKYPWEVRKSGNGVLDLSCSKIKRFSNKETAEDWLAKNKPKDLLYYEDLLICDKSVTISFPVSLQNNKFYYTLKEQEPRLFYLKVLELIQQDLDEGWKPDWNDKNQDKWFIGSTDNKISIDLTNVLNRGQQVFKSEQSAKKTLELMRDKLDIIFK